MRTKTAKIGLLLATFALVLPMSLPSGAIAAGSTATVLITENSYSPQLYTFNPPLLTVSPGTTVTWVNTGMLYHTVTMKASTTGDTFDMGIEPGQSFSFTFTTTGAVVYHCIPHELPQNGNMRGGVVVA
jgi:plastocyanin